MDRLIYFLYFFPLLCSDAATEPGGQHVRFFSVQSVSTAPSEGNHSHQFIAPYCTSASIQAAYMEFISALIKQTFLLCIMYKVDSIIDRGAQTQNMADPVNMLCGNKILMGGS